MLGRIMSFEDSFIMYDPETFDASMPWKEVVTYKKEKGTSPKGCVVLTVEEYKEICKLLVELKMR